MVMIGRAYSVGFGVFCWFVCLFGVFARWCMQVSVQVGIPVCTHTRTQRTQQDIKCRPLTLCVVKCSLLCLKIVKLWCTGNPEDFFLRGDDREWALRSLKASQTVRIPYGLPPLKFSVRTHPLTSEEGRDNVSMELAGRVGPGRW